MSAFGLQIFSHLGGLTFSSDETTWNFVDSFIVPGGSGLFKQYFILHNKEVMVVQQLINAPPVDRRAIAHTVTVNDTVVGATGGSETALIVVLMR